MIKLFLIMSTLHYGSHLDATKYLRKAGAAASRGDCASVIENTELAAGFGLDPFTSAAAYWNAYICCDKVGNDDGVANSLLGFIVYVHESKRVYERAGMPNKLKDWIFGYKIDEKYKFASVSIQALWAGRNDYSCRSEEFNCFIYSKEDIKLYARSMSFCGNDAYVAESTDGLFRVIVDCGKTKEQYYFGLVK